MHLINLLHLGRLICSSLNLLEWWKVVVVAKALVVIVNAETELDHAVNPACELSRLVQIEDRRQKRSVKEEPNEVLYRLVGFVRGGFLLKLRHDGVFGVDFHGLFGN